MRYILMFLLLVSLAAGQVTEGEGDFEYTKGLNGSDNVSSANINDRDNLSIDAGFSQSPSLIEKLKGMYENVEERSENELIVEKYYENGFMNFEITGYAVNVELFESIPKELLDNASELNSSSDFEVIEEDPLVMWSFASVEGTEKVKYEADEDFIGETETVVLSGEVEEEKDHEDDGERNKTVEDNVSEGNLSVEDQENDEDRNDALPWIVIALVIIAVIAIKSMEKKK
ncbi:MAG: hypothetical protein ACQEP1_06115 [Nanobdellota archaeon]